jgi:hypothetical protein
LINISLDTTILNFVLTVDHIQNAFYQGALAKFNEAAFTEAGLPASVRVRFTQIANHEAAYVEDLEGKLGGDRVGPCTYDL